MRKSLLCWHYVRCLQSLIFFFILDNRFRMLLPLLILIFHNFGLIYHRDNSILEDQKQRFFNIYIADEFPASCCRFFQSTHLELGCLWFIKIFIILNDFEDSIFSRLPRDPHSEWKPRKYFHVLNSKRNFYVFGNLFPQRFSDNAGKKLIMCLTNIDRH